MNKVIIYGFEGSTYVRTALMTCIEKGVAYELAGFEFGSAQHLELHPFMKMPIANIDGQHVYETLAITTLIDDLTGKSLQPDQPPLKAVMLQWISSAIDDLYPILVKNMLSDEPVSAGNINEVSKVLVLIENAIHHNKHFLNGRTITLADLFLYPMLHFASNKVNEFSSLTAELPHLRKWLAAMDERQSVVKTVPVFQ